MKRMSVFVMKKKPQKTKIQCSTQLPYRFGHLSSLTRRLLLRKQKEVVLRLPASVRGTRAWNAATTQVKKTKVTKFKCFCPWTLWHPEPERPFVHLWGKWQPSMCELHPVLLQRPHPPLFYSPIAQYCSTSPMKGNADEMQTLKEWVIKALKRSKILEHTSTAKRNCLSLGWGQVKKSRGERKGEGTKPSKEAKEPVEYGSQEK